MNLKNEFFLPFSYIFISNNYVPNAWLEQTFIVSPIPRLGFVSFLGVTWQTIQITELVVCGSHTTLLIDNVFQIIRPQHLIHFLWYVTLSWLT